jgi:hypothetical protein
LSYNGGDIDVFVAKLNATGRGLVYAGFLGGSGFEVGHDIAVDNVGNAYIAGETGSTDFPVTVGPNTTFNGGISDVFVAKLNVTGTGLIYAGFLGGSSRDEGWGIAVDGAENLYVTGYTSSNDFPAIVGPNLTYGGGEYDAFVAKVNATGTGLVYAGFLGGSDWDWGYGIAVDGVGNAYVAGETKSANFPVTVGPDLTYGGGICGISPTYPCADAFVAKVNAAGTGLVYAGFLGGSSGDGGYGITVDDAGNAYVTGWTQSADFPAIVGPDLTHNGGNDAFITKVDATGAGLVYAGFLGGSSNDGGSAIALDGAGNVYIAGGTSSADFPVIGGPNLIHNGNTDAFVAKVNSAGTELAYASFLGGSDWDASGGIAVDSVGNVYIAGQTSSTDFPATSGVFDDANNGGFDAFVTKIGVAVTSAVFGRVTGTGGDAIAGVLISVGSEYTATTDPAGNYSLAGLTPGAYTLTPTKPGWVFMPPTRTVTLPPDAVGQNFTMLHPPVSVTLALSGTANLPASLSYVDTQGLTTTVLFPAGAVTATTTIVLTPTLPIAGSNLAFAGHAFDMEAYQNGVWSLISLSRSRRWSPSTTASKTCG